MANSQKPCNLLSNASTSNLEPIASELENVLLATKKASFYTTFCTFCHAVQEPAVTMEVALESDGEDPSSSPAQKTTPVSEVSLTLTELVKLLRLRASIGKIVQEGITCIYAFKNDLLLIKAAKNTLPDAFQNGYDEASDGSKNLLFYFVETVFTKMVHSST